MILHTIHTKEYTRNLNTGTTWYDKYLYYIEHKGLFYEQIHWYAVGLRPVDDLIKAVERSNVIYNKMENKITDKEFIKNFNKFLKEESRFINTLNKYKELHEEMVKTFRTFKGVCPFGGTLVFPKKLSE